MEIIMFRDAVDRMWNFIAVFCYVRKLMLR